MMNCNKCKAEVPFVMDIDELRYIFNGSAHYEFDSDRETNLFCSSCLKDHVDNDVTEVKDTLSGTKP